MEPEAGKLRSAQDEKLRKRETAAVHLEAVGEALKLFIGLDHGMIHESERTVGRQFGLYTVVVETRRRVTRGYPDPAGATPA